MKNIVKVLVLCVLTASGASALDVTGTDPAVIKGAAKGDFNFSGISVKGITYEKGGVVMPVTESKGRTYSDVKLISKSLYGKIEACFKNGCAPYPAAGHKPTAKVSSPVVKLKELKPLKSKTRVANAELSFDGDLLVIAGVMVSSKDPGTFWLAFPETMEFTDAAFKAAVEKTVNTAWAKKNK